MMVSFRLPTGLLSASTFLSGIALSVCLGTLPGVAQSSSPEEPGQIAQNLIAQATVQMGTEADYIPFEYRYASDRVGSSGESEIIGFDIAVAQYITDRLGLTLEIQEQEFTQLFSALRRGELDFAVAAITPTDIRRRYLDFSEPYFEARHAMVSRRSSPVRTAKDLPGKRVAVQTGSMQEQVLREHVAAGLDVEVVAIDQLKEMIAAVRDGKAEVALVEELVAEAYLENNPSLEMDVLGEVEPTPVAIAFPQGSPYVEPFNQVIRAMKANGELEQLTKQWFVAQP